MLVSLMSSKTLTAANGSGPVTYTRPVEVEEHNYFNFTVNLRDIEDLAGTPNVSLVTTAEGSMNGQDWITIPSVGVTRTAVGVGYDAGYILYPRMRFRVEFTASGSPGDQVAVVFCLQVNLVSK